MDNASEGEQRARSVKAEGRSAAATKEEGPLVAALPASVGPKAYGQADVRSTVLELIGIPGTVGVLSESADVPEAVAE
jgi:hypothetical protein